ncbi:MAG: hypothetical protein FWF15_07060 [Oscillospiraceae bacterium]|nr:hypothetical protein [Oscillospiraceae bacterium]
MKNKIIFLMVLLLIVLLTGCRDDNYDDELIEAEFVPTTVRKLTNVYKTVQIDVPERMDSNFLLRDNLIYLLSGNVLISWDLNGYIVDEKVIPDPVNHIAVCSGGEYVIVSGTSLIKESVFSIDLKKNINGLFVDKKDNIYVYTQNEIFVYWPDGEEMYNVSVPGMIFKLTEGFDGKIIIDTGNYYFLDTSKRALSDCYFMPKLVYENNYEVFFGGGYDFYMRDDMALYGYSRMEGGQTKIVDFINSDVNVFKIAAINVLSYDKIILIYSDTTVDLLIRSPEGIPNKTILKAAAFGIDEFLVTKIIDFNLHNPFVRIALTDYSKYKNFDIENYGLHILDREVAAGDIPDIFISNEFLNLDKYVVDGVLLDLSARTGMIGFIKSIISALYDEGIYELPVEFSMEALIGKTKNVGENLNWSIYTPMKNVRLLGNGSSFNLKFLILADFRSFVGANLDPPVHFTASNYFESILEFNHNLAVLYLKEYSGDATPEQYIDDEVLFYAMTLNNFSDYLAAKEIFGGDEITIKGYPNQIHDGIILDIKKSYAIAKTCADIENAWDFLLTLFDNNYEYKYWPATKSGFNKIFEFENEENVEYMEKFFDVFTPEVPEDEIIEVYYSLNTEKRYHASFVYDIIAKNSDGSFNRTANLVQWQVSLYFAKYKLFS